MKEYEKIINQLKNDGIFQKKDYDRLPKKLNRILSRLENIHEERESYCESQPMYRTNTLHLPHQIQKGLICSIPKYMMPFVCTLSRYLGCVVIYRSFPNNTLIEVENRSIAILGQDKDSDLCIAILDYFIGDVLRGKENLTQFFKNKNKVLFGKQPKADKKVNDYLIDKFYILQRTVSRFISSTKYSYSYYNIKVSTKKAKTAYKLQGIISSTRGFSNNRIVIHKEP